MTFQYATKHKFYPEEVEELKAAWVHLKEVKSEGNGSAFGEHYKLTEILKKCGVDIEFESGSQIENYVEYVITYGESPDVY